VWSVEIVDRKSGGKRGDLQIGIQTGAIYSWQQVHSQSAPA
jgi:hypothetical protein